jgi:hypothetical protein
MQLKAQQLLQRLAGKQQQTVPEAAAPAADAPAAASNMNVKTSLQPAPAEWHQAQRGTQPPSAHQQQRKQQPDQLTPCQPAAVMCHSVGVDAVQSVHAASHSSAAGDARSKSGTLLCLQPQQLAAAYVGAQAGPTEPTTSPTAVSCAAASSTVSYQEQQEVQARQPEHAAAPIAVAAADGDADGDHAAVLADRVYTADAPAAVCGAAGEDGIEQQNLQQGGVQQALGSTADDPVSHLQAPTKLQCMTAAEEQPTKQQHEMQQQQQVQQLHGYNALVLRSDATEQLQQQQQQQHDSQQQQTPEAVDIVESSSQHQDTNVAQQLQPQPQRLGSIDRQQLQQKLRQLLAAEQRKQHEEQRREQLLAQQLAEQQEALASMHYKMVLVRRLGLQPWLALLKLRTEQQVAAGTWRAVHLARTAMLLWKEQLVQR